MSPDDFPPGTKYFIKGADVPVAVYPDGRQSSWYGGTPTHWSNERLTFAKRKSLERFVEVTFSEFAKLVAASEQSTAEQRGVVLVQADTLMAEAATRAIAEREKLAALKAKWERGGEGSSFPEGTRFFIRGGDEPIAVLPGYKGSSWYGGTPTQWDNDHFVFAWSDSKETFEEVGFGEFTKIVAQSVGSRVNKAALLAEEFAPLLAKLKADRAEGARRPAVDHDDYMYCRPDKYGIWRDSDGDPI